MNQNQFYYSSLSIPAPTVLPVYFTSIDCCNSISDSYTIDSIDGIIINSCTDCFDLTFCWNLSKGCGKFASANVCVVCNGVCIRGCSIGTIASYSCNGTFSAFTQDYNDTVCVYTAASDINCLAGASSTICLCTLTNCVGCYCIDTPASNSSTVGAT